MQVTSVLDHLVREVLGQEERRLLDISLSDRVSQEELDAFLSGWDINSASIHSVILLAHLMKTHPSLSFPSEIQPRLKGVLTYCRFQNLKLVAHFSRIGSALNKAQIPFVILKGGAMKVYRPDYPRWMGDIDILVGEEDFLRSEKVVEGLGYIPFQAPHSIDFRLAGSEEGIVDLHRYIQMNTGREKAFNSELASRSQQREMFSVQGHLPCPEDMVFISLVNLYKNLSDATCPGSVLNTFNDLSYLVHVKEGFDWTIVRENACRTGTEMQLWLSASFVSTVLPELFPAGFLSEWIAGPTAETQGIRLLYRREVLSPLREEIGEFNLWKALRQKRPLGKYIGKRAAFFFLKRQKNVRVQEKVLWRKGIAVE